MRNPLTYLLQRIMGPSVIVPWMTGEIQDTPLHVGNLLQNTPLLTMFKIAQRAEHGRPLVRPVGSRRLPFLDNLVFLPVELDPLPVPKRDPVETAVVLGPQAERPLRLATPILITAMAYGLSLSKKAKIALARASTLAGTCTNTGEGPFLPEERETAERLIIQYSRNLWNKGDEVLQQADMLEIQIGQGAAGAGGSVTEPEYVEPGARPALGLGEEESARIPARLPGVKDPADLRQLVRRLREVGRGVPVGIKLAAGHLERDLGIAVEAGVDAITIDGAEGATSGSLEITVSHFGLPLAHAIARAHRYLVRAGVRQQVSLIASGGLREPGDFLKIMALGADAAAIGTAALMALVHTQLTKVFPGQWPAELFLAHGRRREDLDVERAGRSLANFIGAATEEMAHGARALGKRRLADVSAQDLVALDEETGRLTGVPWLGDLADGPLPRQDGVVTAGKGLDGQGHAGARPDGSRRR